MAGLYKVFDCVNHHLQTPDNTISICICGMPQRTLFGPIIFMVMINDDAVKLNHQL